MDVAYLRQLLEQVAEKKTNIDEALTELKKLPYEDIGYANIDQHRNLRTGQGEVIFGQGKTPEQILETVLAGFDVTFHETVDAGFVCDCSAERVERSLCSLGDEDVADIIADGKPIEVKCQFCNKAYNYTVDELIEMRKRK